MYLQDVPTPRFVASDRLFRPTDEFSSSRVNVPCHQREALGALPPSAIVILFPGTGKERRDAWLHPEIRKPHSPATDLSCGVALSEALASQHTRGRESRPRDFVAPQKTERETQATFGLQMHSQRNGNKMFVSPASGETTKWHPLIRSGVAYTSIY
uniref:Uncharacterized protein n=1 Tax=Toxoplasma gondii COUG TaxID=1074873 RepID=A0A2G8Y2U5_TOXGO|nr:hypothetical protein TGCOUG_290210 [Toxoplasma gondii COUG]